MKKTKKTTRWLFSLFVGVMAIIFGVNGSVLMAEAADLPDGGKSDAGAATEHANPGTGGAATETTGREAMADDPDFYTKDIDKRITKIRPMATPVDQISRYATAQHSDSFECKYYSVGTRPMRTTVKTALGEASTGTTVTIEVDDPELFTIDDTIRVVGIKAVTDYKGSTYADGKHKVIPDLELCVVDKDSNGYPIVYAINGNDVSGKPYGVPALKKGQVLIRMGKSCGELDVQTGRFNNLPTSEENYCQNFMAQVEQSTFDKIAGKVVDWNFNDLEEDSIYDMRLGMECSFMFGDMAKINHSKKDGMTQWFTRGIWWQAGKDIKLGHVATEEEVKKGYASGSVVISDLDLVDISEDLFVGTGLAAQRKIVLAGSKVISAFSKINSDKFRLKDSVEAWNLRFKSWETDFGEILMIHSELFDQNGMEDCAFALDPEYLVKKTHLSWGRNVLDLKSAGVRNTDAVVLQEVSCLILKYPKAHARMKLAA